MSRRLRKEEQERIQSTKKDFLEQDKLKLRKERIYAPLVWRVTADNFKVMDLQEKYFDEALFMIKEYYLPNDVVTRSAAIVEDEVSLNSLMAKARYFLKDCSSLAVVHETYEMPESTTETDLQIEPRPVHTLAGVLILKAMHKSDHGRTFSSIIMTNGEAQKKCIAFYAAVHRGAQVTEIMKCESYLTYFYTCIKPEYRHKGLGYKMMISGLDVARSLHMDVVTGIFTCYSLQRLAKKMGMRVLYEIAYVEWRDKNGDIIFDDPGAGNYTCALMAGRVPKESIPEPKIKIVKQEQSTLPKLTRVQKREILLKDMQKRATSNG